MRPRAQRHDQRPADGRSLGGYRARASERGVNRVVYWVVRAVLQPFFHVYFRLRRFGREHVPASGPVILAANHRSFLDPFLIGVCVRRPIYFVAKQELFAGRLQAWFLNALGAFPIRRGESDEDAIETAKSILARGDVVVIFPEGTRIRSGSLGTPRRGVGRLALESGAPVVPVAVTGSEHARRGWRIRPVSVRVRIGRPLTFPRVERASSTLATEVTERIWPCVELQWEWLGGLPPLRKVAVVGAGSMGSALAVLLSRAGLDVQLACRNRDRAAALEEARGRADAGLPAAAEAPRLSVMALGDIELAGIDLLVLAVPAAALPAIVAKVGDRVGARTGVLVCSKGVVPPLGARAARYAGERLNARAIAALGGPCHAAEAVESGASVVLAGTDPDFVRQLATALGDGGLDVETTADVVGVELAGAAKNAAALAASAAARSGPNAAGAAAAAVFAELERLALRSGGHPETFRGLAGTGDLVATVIAPHSRNRRAGELLADGIPAEQVEGAVGAAAEAVRSVPLLAQMSERAGVEAPATAALASMVEGRLSAQEWIERVRARAATGASGGARAA